MTPSCFSHAPTVRVHGLSYVDLSPEELRRLLEYRLAHFFGTTIFTPNAKIGADCMEDAQLHALLSCADFLLPDGAGVLAASRRQCPTYPLTHRLPGIEAGESILRLCAIHGYPVYFLGGKPHIAARAASHWKNRLPPLIVAGVHDGFFEKSGQENEQVVKQIKASGAAVVLVCFGFPKQERWIIENRDALAAVRLFIGLGGSFDVWAGNIRRAPRPFRRAHLEWLWRGLCEPRRLGDVPRMLRYVYHASNGEK